MLPAKIRPTRPSDVMLCMLIASVSMTLNGCVERLVKMPSVELFCKFNLNHKYTWVSRANGKLSKQARLQKCIPENQV